MLGFSALSAAPLSATAGGDVVALLTTNLLSGTVNDTTFIAEANITNPAVSATSTFADLDIQVSNSVDVTTLLATSSVEALAFIAEASKAVTGLSTTSSVNSLSFTADALHTITAISADLDISALDFDAKANITTSSVDATLTLVDITTFLQASASITLTTVLGRFSTNLPIPADNLFDYDAFADLYSGSRTVHILNNSLGIGNTVHVAPENYTLYIDAYKDSPETIYVSPENYTVYIDAYKGIPTKVLITQ